MAIVDFADEAVNCEERANSALRRSQGYWLLSRLFAEVPSSARLAETVAAVDQMLVDTVPVNAELTALKHELTEALADPEAVAVAFTRYLTLIPKDSEESFPYESYFREGQFPGEATRQVDEFIIDAGYDNIAPDLPSVDHLAVELRLMAYLCHSEFAAWRDGKQAAAMDSMNREDAFLSTHLATWAPYYCDALAINANHGYIRAIARLAARTIRDDASTVSGHCAKGDYCHDSAIATA